MKLQFLSFAVVGALGFLVDATALQLLLNVAGLDPYSGRLGSFLVAVTFTWAMNRHFTFASEDPRLLREWFRFLSANSLGAGVNLGTYGFLVWAVPLVAAHPVLGVAAGSIAGLSVNFLGSRYFVFRGVAGGEGNSRRPLDFSGFPWRPGGAQAFEFWLLAACGVYVLLCLSPSSYGQAFQSLLLEPVGLYLGEARPLRSDEYAVWTPYIQIAVNNGFARFNATSPYLEDLRNFNALPLLDWGLLFKPQFWGFFVLDPAWAYSLHHAIFIAAFLAGWRRLFHAFGFGWTEATLAAFVVFFFPYTQLWWTTTGSLLAGFPWLILCFLWQTAAWKRVLAMAWLSASWLISHLYPPIILTAAFAGVFLLLAFKPRETFRPGTLLTGLLGAAIGAGLAALYLQDAITVMSGTVYPGDRRLDGGEMELGQWLATFLPGLWTEGRGPVIPTSNYLESAAGGSFLLLGCLLFCSRDSIVRLFRSGDDPMRSARRQLLLLSTGAALISLWALAPLPSWVGAPLYWDKILAARFVFALGLLSFAAGLVLARRLDFVITPARLVVAPVLFVSAYAAIRARYMPAFELGGPEIWGAAVFLLVLAGAHLFLKARPVTALLGACVCAGGLVYGSYNPVQSSFPIFHRPVHPEEADFRSAQDANPEHFLLTRDVPGAILNAWGYRAIQHVLVYPQLDFFRQRFPDLPPRLFNRVFNRYAHIKLTDEATPFVPQVAPGVLQHDVIRVPRAAFSAPGQGESRGDEKVAGLQLLDAPLEATAAIGGVIDEVTWNANARTLVIRGWARLSVRDPANNLLLFVPGAQDAGTLEAVYRPDVVYAHGNDHSLAYSGFEATVRLGAGLERPEHVCVWSKDRAGQTVLLNDPAASGMERCGIAQPED